MLAYYHDLEKQSEWILVDSSQVPWQPESGKILPYIQELGNFYANELFYTERSDLPSYLIKYVASGSGILEYEGKTYHLGIGDCFWIDCQKYQKYYTDPAVGKWHTLWVHFYGQQCHEYYQMFRKMNNSPIFHISDDEDPESMFLSMIQEYKKSYLDSALDIRSAELLVHIMCFAILSYQQQNKEPVPDAIRKAQEYITEHFNEKISLDELCLRFHISKHYFIRQFKKYVGTTPHNFIISRRMREAKVLLRGSELPIEDIAEQTGFVHASHLINCFQKLEGITPSRYRTQLKQ